jgi:hypothetical protein
MLYRRVKLRLFLQDLGSRLAPFPGLAEMGRDRAAVILFFVVAELPLGIFGDVLA